MDKEARKTEIVCFEEIEMARPNAPGKKGLLGFSQSNQPKPAIDKKSIEKAWK